MAQGTLAGIGRALEGAIQWMVDLPIHIRLAYRDWAEARSMQKAKAQIPTVEERQADLLAFYERFEDLVETVCDAANYGPEKKLAERYAQLRAWMQVEYPKVRPYLTAYLPLKQEPENPAAGYGTEGRDAFESLYAEETLGAILEGDDGTLIERVMQTRDALYLYGEHLRRLKGKP